MQKILSASRQQPRQCAFTLVELLVVIGIIVLLVGLLLVAVSRSYGVSRRVRVQADLQTISLGLEAYKQDFGDYPRPQGTAATDGARTLCLALVGPGPATGAADADGADGPGFRTRGIQGKVYGPYIDVSKFDLTGDYLHDRVLSEDPKNSPPILYIPARPAVSTQQRVTPEQAYVGVDGTPATWRYVFNIDQCSTWIGSASWIQGASVGNMPPGVQMRGMMGDTDNSGNINGAENAACTAPFILWTAGADGMFGLRYDNGKYVTDDVANFEFDSSIQVK